MLCIALRPRRQGDRPPLKSAMIAILGSLWQGKRPENGKEKRGEVGQPLWGDLEDCWKAT